MGFKSKGRFESNRKVWVKRPYLLSNVIFLEQYNHMAVLTDYVKPLKVNLFIFTYTFGDFLIHP